MDPFPAKIVIETNRIYSENSNRPHNYGPIELDSFTPYPKNPLIARVFKEIGFADELGSGVRNLYKYTETYSNSEPQLIEEDIFKLTIPLTEQGTEQVTEYADRIEKILVFCSKPRATKEIMEHIGLSHREHFRSEILTPLIKEGLIALTIPDKPKTPLQKYYTVKKDIRHERS